MRLADPRVRPDLLWRAGLVAVLVVAAMLGAPEPLMRVGSVVSIAVAAERLARRRGRGPLDAVVLAGGGLLAGLVLLGLLVGGSWGLSTRTWAVAIGIAALVALAGASRGRPETGSDAAPTDWREVLRAAPWVAATIVVVVVAVGTAGRSAERAVPANAPTTGLAMSFGAVSATTVDVVVTAPAGPSAPGPCAIRVTVGRTEISYPVFTPAAGRPHTSQVSVPMTGRYTVDLVDPEDGTVVRSLVIAR